MRSFWWSSLVVQRLQLSAFTTAAWVQTLVLELRCHIKTLYATTKKKKKKESGIFLLSQKNSHMKISVGILAISTTSQWPSRPNLQQCHERTGRPMVNRFHHEWNINAQEIKILNTTEQVSHTENHPNDSFAYSPSTHNFLIRHVFYTLLEDIIEGTLQKFPCL